MPLINLTVRHNQTLDEAKANMAKAVEEARGALGPIVSRVDWSADGSQVTLAGSGFEARMWVDATDCHVTGDIPLLGQFFVGPIKKAIERSFPKSLPSG